jgi:transcriptional regulator with XRE-family HTH domain
MCGGLPMSEYKGSINNEEVGKRIKEIRESNNLTQEQMAEILKVTTNAVRDYEKGNYGISKDVMLLIRQNFNVSIDYLLFGENTDMEKLFFLLENASENDKMKVLAHLMRYFVDGKRRIYRQDTSDWDETAKKMRDLFGD